jgi:HAE1 family hydrophobic/amphiphilic exporter-1
MNLSGISIKRKVTLAMIYIIAIGFGIFSLTQLKVAMTPDIDFPIVLVFTNYRESVLKTSKTWLPGLSRKL